jgi:hypothetical protein
MCDLDGWLAGAVGDEVPGTAGFFADCVEKTVQVASIAEWKVAILKPEQSGVLWFAEARLSTARSNCGSEGLNVESVDHSVSVDVSWIARFAYGRCRSAANWCGCTRGVRSSAHDYCRWN